MARFGTRRLVVAAAATLAVVGGAAAAVAATGGGSRGSDFLDSVAKHLGVSPQKLQDATKAAAVDQVNADLAAGGGDISPTRVLGPGRERCATPTTARGFFESSSTRVLRCDP